MKQLEFLADLVIPFLSPPNQKWPEFLLNNRQKDQINMANFRRARNMESIDLVIDSHKVSGECKYYEKPIDSETIAEIYSNIP